MPQFIISLLIYSLIFFSLFILFIKLAILDYLYYILLSAFIGIMSAFVSIFFVNKYIYKMKNDYKITREFLISVVIAFVIFLILLIADPEITILDQVIYSGYIGIISVFASMFIVGKFFQKDCKEGLKI